MTERIFCLLLRQSQKREKKLEVQLFLVRLQVLLALAQPYFYLMFKTSVIGLIVNLAINGAESISGKVGISFFGY